MRRLLFMVVAFAMRLSTAVGARLLVVGHA